MERIGDMDLNKKLNCRAKSEVIGEVRKPFLPPFCEIPSLLIEHGWQLKMVPTSLVQEQPNEKGPHVTDNDCERKDHAQ